MWTVQNYRISSPRNLIAVFDNVQNVRITGLAEARTDRSIRVYWENTATTRSHDCGTVQRVEASSITRKEADDYYRRSHTNSDISKQLFPEWKSITTTKYSYYYVWRLQVTELSIRISTESTDKMTIVLLEAWNS